jgi:hypothetical protein
VTDGAHPPAKPEALAPVPQRVCIGHQLPTGWTHAHPQQWSRTPRPSPAASWTRARTPSFRFVSGSCLCGPLLLPTRTSNYFPAKTMKINKQTSARNPNLASSALVRPNLAAWQQIHTTVADNAVVSPWYGDTTPRKGVYHGVVDVREVRRC